MTNLPQWLQDQLPEMREVEYIDYDPKDDFYSFRELFFVSPVDAYDYASGKTDNVAFTESARANFPGDTWEGLFFADEDNRILLQYTDNDSLEYLEMMFQQFQEIDEAYRKNPEDWAIAYEWVKHHPAFWIKSRRDDWNKKTWDWHTENGIQDIYVYLHRYEDGRPMVCFEGGGHTPDYSGCYHDYRMDVYEPTFEEAYVSYAKITDKFFNVDGTEKPRVDED